MRKNREAERKFLKRSITLCDLQTMDVHHDGNVSLDEFLCCMLVVLNKVDKETIEDIKSLFRQLDVTTLSSLRRPVDSDDDKTNPKERLTVNLLGQREGGSGGAAQAVHP